MAKNTILSDDEIVTKVVAKSKDSVGWFDSRLSKESARVLGYYNGELPRRQHEGASSYVSTDVYDAVEMLKAQLLEVFAGGDHIAQFDPDSEMSSSDCLVATQYATYVIFRENPGYDLFQQVIHDGLTNRAGIAKVFWEEKYTYAEETFDNVPPHVAMGMAAQDDVDEFEGNPDDEVGTSYSGSLVRKTDVSQVSIIIIPTEEFLISPRARLVASAPYVGHRTLKTKAELIEMGYDPKKVNALNYDDSKSLELSPEALAREKPVATVTSVDSPIQPEMEQVLLYESFVRMVIDSKKGVRLYKICHVNDTLLDYQEVDKAPFFPYVPLPTPHTFYGNNFAARVIPFQNAQTVLHRGVLDHTAITTNPRWQVVKGGLMNPREMLENRLGGLVNVTRPDSVTALQYPNLNPFIFQVIGALKENKEQSTGISSLSQGLNKDAISSQNSQGLVDNLVTLSNQRQKIAARNFAYNFFIPIMLEVVRLGILNEKKPKMIEVAGAPLQVNPKNWTERKTCTVSMHLGYGEKDQVIGQMTQGYAMMAQDPVIAPLFGQEQRFNMAHDIMKLRGWAGRSRYLAQPGPNTQPQPDPLEVQKLQIAGKEADAAMLTAQVAQQKLAQDGQIEGVKLHNKQQDTVLKALNHDREQDRKDADVSNKINATQQDAAHKQQDTIVKAIQNDREQDRKDADTANAINVSQQEIALAKHTARRQAYISP